MYIFFLLNIYNQYIFLFVFHDRDIVKNKLENVKVETVGWGDLYSELAQPSDNGNEISSCMTSEFGPLKTRFLPCNMVQVDNNVIFFSLFVLN